MILDLGCDELEAAARLVHRVVAPTPQYVRPLLCSRAGCEVRVKHENQTATGAFKIRGALVMIDRRADRPARRDGACHADRQRRLRTRRLLCALLRSGASGRDRERRYLRRRHRRARAGTRGARRDPRWRRAHRPRLGRGDEGGDARLLQRHALEPAGAASFAALLKDPARRGRRFAVIASGGNVDRELYAAVLAG